MDCKVGDWVDTSKGVVNVTGFILEKNEMKGNVKLCLTQPESRRGEEIVKHWSYCKRKTTDMTPDDYHDLYSLLVDLPLATHDKPYFMELCQESQYMQGSRW
jgi:hypothetical protein